MFFSKRLFRPVILISILFSLLTLIVFQNCGGNIESNKKLTSENVNQDFVKNEEDDDIENGDFTLEPEIYTHLSGGPGIQPGAKVFIVSNVEGQSLSYQWYHRLNGDSHFLPISGATSASYEMSRASLADEGTYYVEVTSPQGGPFLSNQVEIILANTTEPGALDIDIVQQPASTLIFQEHNGTLSVEVSSESGQVGFNWQRRSPGHSDWTTISNNSKFTGQGTMSLTINHVDTEDIAFFRVLVDNGLSGTERISKTSQEVLLSIFTQPMPDQVTTAPNNTINFSCNIMTVKPNESLSSSSDITWEYYDRKANQNQWIPIPTETGNATGSTYSSTVNARYSAYRCSVNNFFGERVSKTSNIDHSSWYEVPTTEIDGAKYRLRLRERNSNREYDFMDSGSRIMRSGSVFSGGTIRWRWKRKLPSETQFTFIQNSQMNNIITQNYVADHQGTYDLGQPTEFQAYIFDEFGMYHVTPNTALVKGGTSDEISETTLNMSLNNSVRIEFESFIQKTDQSWSEELPLNISFLWQRWDGTNWIDLSDNFKNQQGIIVSSGNATGSSRYRLRVTVPNGSQTRIQKFHIFNILAH